MIITLVFHYLTNTMDFLHCALLVCEKKLQYVIYYLATQNKMCSKIFYQMQTQRQFRREMWIWEVTEKWDLNSRPESMIWLAKEIQWASSG